MPVADSADGLSKCAEVRADSGERLEDGSRRALTAGTARIASAAGLRQIIQTGTLALTVAVVAHALGPHQFGIYSSGTAAYSLAVAFTDLGFSLYLAREMSRHPEAEAKLMGIAVPALLLWTWVPTLALGLLGAFAGGSRGGVMVVLCPAVLLGGLIVSRQIFTVRFIAGPLVSLDVAATLLQALVTVILAVFHASIIWLALNLGVWSGLVNLGAYLLARRLIDFPRPTRAEITSFIRGALPMGLALILTSLYFTIDMTLLGWLTTPRALGAYAAAVRLLSIVVMLPGLVLAAGIPGLSRAGDDVAELSAFTATLAHWIAVTALPVCVAFAVFARPIVEIMFGADYASAVPLVRILMLAGGVTFLSNIAGMLLMTQGIIARQIYFNSLSLAVNVAGNVLFVPQHGVAVSAWLTVICESIGVGYGWTALAGRVRVAPMLRAVWRPGAAMLLAAITGLALGAEDVLSAVAAAGVFLAVITVLAGWPTVLTEWLSGRLRRGSPND